MKIFIRLITLLLLIGVLLLGFNYKNHIIDYSFTPKKCPPPTISYDRELLYKYDKYVKLIYVEDNKKYVKYLNYKDISKIELIDNKTLYLLVFTDKANKSYSIVYKDKLDALFTKYLIKKLWNEGVFMVDINKLEFTKELQKVKNSFNKGLVVIEEPYKDMNLENIVTNELKREVK